MHIYLERCMQYKSVAHISKVKSPSLSLTFNFRCIKLRCSGVLTSCAQVDGEFELVLDEHGSQVAIALHTKKLFGFYWSKAHITVSGSGLIADAGERENLILSSEDAEQFIQLLNVGDYIWVIFN